MLHSALDPTVVAPVSLYGLLANAPIIGGMPTSAAVFVVVSLLTRPSEAQAGARGAV